VIKTALGAWRPTRNRAYTGIVDLFNNHRIGHQMTVVRERIITGLSFTIAV
jgi:hypothetical protein